MQRISEDQTVKLPILGTTWQRRGANYWTRRCLYSLLMAITVVIETAVVVALWDAITSSTGRVIFVGLEGALTIYTGAVVFRGMRRIGTADSAASKPANARAIKRAGTAGSVIGLLARAGAILGGLFIVVGSLLTYGLVLTIFIRSFLPRLDVERKGSGSHQQP